MDVDEIAYMWSSPSQSRTEAPAHRVFALLNSAGVLAMQPGVMTHKFRPPSGIPKGTRLRPQIPP